VESARNELIIKIIPKCSIQSQANEDDDDEENYERSSLTAITAEVEGEKESTMGRKQPTIKDCLLSCNMEQPISIGGTTWRWLRRLGCRHDHRKKSFFVDGHECPDVVFYRNDFCSNNLSKLEPRMY
jgi:hypothetical protein